MGTHVEGGGLVYIGNSFLHPTHTTHQLLTLKPFCEEEQ